MSGDYADMGSITVSQHQDKVYLFVDVAWRPSMKHSPFMTRKFGDAREARLGYERLINALKKLKKRKSIWKRIKNLFWIIRYHLKR